MANFLKLSGIIGSTFQIDKTSATPGSILKNTSGALSVRNSTDSADAPLVVGISYNADLGTDIAANLAALAARNRIEGSFEAPTYATNPVNKGDDQVSFLICTRGPDYPNAWVSGVTYAALALVTYQGQWYQTTAGFTGSTPPPQDGGNWTPYSTGNTRDGWNNLEAYAISAQVWYQGYWWTNNTAGTLTNEIPSPGSDWDLQGDAYSIGDIAISNGTGSGPTIKVGIRGGDQISTEVPVASGTEWNATPAYASNTYVTYEGSWWYNYTGFASTPGDDPPSTPAEWNSQTPATATPYAHDAWDVSVTYAIDAYVVYDGDWYKNVSGATSTGDDPQATPTVWAVVNQAFSLDNPYRLFIFSNNGGFLELLSGYTGIAKAIRVDFEHGDFAGGTLASTATIPNGATILRSRVGVYNQFTATATVSVGYTGAVTLLQTTADNDLQTSGYYIVEDTSTGAGWNSTLPVLLTFAGTTIIAGTGYVLVEYVTPDA